MFYRIGKSGTLIVSREENEEIIEERAKGDSSGTHSVLELNPVTTRFLVGGIPSTMRVSTIIQ